MRLLEYRLKFRQRLNMLVGEKNMPYYRIEDGARINRQSLQRYLSGRSYPNYETIILLCRYFDVSADWLLGLE